MKRTKVLLAALCAATATLTCTTATAAFASRSAPRAKPAAATPACTAADLGAWLAVNHAGAGAGTLYVPLEFTNLSKQACTLEGFPGVSALASNGSQLGDAARRYDADKETGVRLAADQSAFALLGYEQAGIASCASKDVRTAYELRVYAPGASQAIDIPWDWATCIKGGNADFLTVTVVTPIGTNGIG
jgi:Protein of unknown function (DUF4232)